jgi:hypothetical protein
MARNEGFAVSRSVRVQKQSRKMGAETLRIS